MPKMRVERLVRFKYPGTDVFLTSQDLFAPPLTELAKSVGVTKYIEGINELSTTPMVKTPTKRIKPADW